MIKLKISGLFIALHCLTLCKQLDVGDTLKFHPINWKTPSPEGWNAQYEIQVSFPTSNESWHKIFMVQTLKCDSLTKGDKFPCGEWDYIWHTKIITDNQGEEIFCIGSFVTPYGKRLELGGEKGWVWKYDITDYAPILKGKRKIIVGNNQELLDLKFLFIKGNPSRDILKVENIYPFGEYKYSDISDDLKLRKKTIHLMANANGYRLKSVISGHGHEGPRNCCEWDSKTHSYYMNGWEIFRWNVWKDCGNNPIYPQGGTWPFDRAGWCPGTKVDEYFFELTPFVTPGDSILFDYGIEPYSDNGEKNGFFHMTHQLFTYGPPNYEIDAEIVEIISPNTEQRFQRINPDLSHPKIKIKNTGKYDLRSLEIIYGLKNKKKSFYNWRGNLSFLQEAILELPPPNWKGIRKNREFEVLLKKPNNHDDQNPINNYLLAEILIPKIFPNNFRMILKTNDLGRSKENSFTIFGEGGKIFYAKDQFQDSTEYDYEITLKSGSYQFLFKDKMEDGISLHWWNRNSSPEKVGIDGELLFVSNNGDTLHQFDPDFGEELRFNFLVGKVP